MRNNRNLLIGIWCSTVLLTGCAKTQTTTFEAAPVATTSAAPQVAPPVQNKEVFNTASISATAYVVYDVASGQIIASKNPHLRRMPASTTKMMTALVALEVYQPDEVVTVTRAADAIGHAIDIVPGETITVIDMVKAMLVNSGNDAAVSLADHHPNGYHAFVNQMNQKVIEFGLKDTHFSNVSGVEADDHYSSAADLAKIGYEVMQNPTIRSIVSTKESTIQTTDKMQTHKLKNLNELLWTTPGVIGIKTGWTEVAGDCLVTYVTREGHDIITVVLQSQDRFKDSKTLIEWTYDSFTW
jgi:D-alanyl-D-alanine carboxypeptidase (penicillin-binding protein 5/6)